MHAVAVRACRRRRRRRRQALRHEVPVITAHEQQLVVQPARSLVATQSVPSTLTDHSRTTHCSNCQNQAGRRRSAHLVRACRSRAGCCPRHRRQKPQHDDVKLTAHTMSGSTAGWLHACASCTCATMCRMHTPQQAMPGVPRPPPTARAIARCTPAACNGRRCRSNAARAAPRPPPPLRVLITQTRARRGWACGRTRTRRWAACPARRRSWWRSGRWPQR